MTDARPPLALPSSEFGWLRRATMLAGVALNAAAWAYEGSRHGEPDWKVAVFFAPLVVSALLANLNHAGAQIVARGLWWFNLGVGTLAALTSRSPQATPAVIALGAGTALLAAGGAGLGGGVASRGGFAPVAFRRPLLLSLVMSVAEVQTLMSGFVLYVDQGDLSLAWQLAVAGALLAVAVVGLYRLRVWGVLLHLIATAFVARFAFLAATMASMSGATAAAVWFAAVVLQLAVPMPMVWALVRRRPVAPPSTAPAVPRLFAALVVGMMIGAAYSGLAVRFF
jgi:hypothetical protein